MQAIHFVLDILIYQGSAAYILVLRSQIMSRMKNWFLAFAEHLCVNEHQFLLEVASTLTTLISAQPALILDHSSGLKERLRSLLTFYSVLSSVITHDNLQLVSNMGCGSWIISDLKPGYIVTKQSCCVSLGITILSPVETFVPVIGSLKLSTPNKYK